MVEKLYKVTSINFTTKNNYLWKPRIYRSFKKFNRLCGNKCLHAFRSLDQMNNYKRRFGFGSYYQAVLWEAEGTVVAVDPLLKVGCSRLRILKPIKVMDTNGLWRDLTRIEKIYFESKGVKF